MSESLLGYTYERAGIISISDILSRIIITEGPKSVNRREALNKQANLPSFGSTLTYLIMVLR